MKISIKFGTGIDKKVLYLKMCLLFDQHTQDCFLNTTEGSFRTIFNYEFTFRNVKIDAEGLYFDKYHQAKKQE